MGTRPTARWLPSPLQMLHHPSPCWHTDTRESASTTVGACPRIRGKPPYNGIPWQGGFPWLPPTWLRCLAAKQPVGATDNCRQLMSCQHSVWLLLHAAVIQSSSTHILHSYCVRACRCDTDGKLEAIGYVAAEGGVTAPIRNAVNLVRPQAATGRHSVL